MSPGFDILTELRMRVIALEDRMTRLEQEPSPEDESSPSLSDTIKEWAPVLLSLVVLLGVLTGKVSVEQAVGLLKGAP